MFLRADVKHFRLLRITPLFGIFGMKGTIEFLGFGHRKRSVEEVIILVKQSIILWNCDSEVFKFVDANSVLHH